MKKKIASMIVLFLITLSAFADVSNNPHYQFTFFSITNKTNFPVALTITATEGMWEKFVAINVPMILNPNGQYQNTLISNQKNSEMESFVSTEVAQISNDRENYLIFGESGNSDEHSVSAHIFDGLGKIFVSSVTNHCADKTVKGYADCELVIQE